MDYKQERMDSKVTMDYETNICGSFNLMRFIRKASFPKVGNPKDVHVKWVAGAVTHLRGMRGHVSVVTPHT